MTLPSDVAVALARLCYGAADSLSLWRPWALLVLVPLVVGAVYLAALCYADERMDTP